MSALRVSPFDVEMRRLQEDWLELQIKGEVDLAVVDVLRDWLEESIAEEANLAVNLAACEFLDCAGLAEILRARERMVQAGRLMGISAISPAVERLFELTGILDTDLVLDGTTELLAVGSR